MRLTFVVLHVFSDISGFASIRLTTGDCSVSTDCSNIVIVVKVHTFLIVGNMSLFVTRAYCCIALLKYLAEAMSMLLHLMDNYYYCYCWFEDVYNEYNILWGQSKEQVPIEIE